MLSEALLDGTSLAVQWLRLWVPGAGAMRSAPHTAWYVLAESFLRTRCQGSRFTAQLWTLGAHCRQPSDRTHHPRPQGPPRGGLAAGSRSEQEGAHNVLTRVLCESIPLCSYRSHFSEEQLSQKRVK